MAEAYVTVWCRSSLVCIFQTMVTVTAFNSMIMHCASPSKIIFIFTIRAAPNVI